MMNHDRAVPVDGDKRPSQRPGYGRSVDESRVGIVSEVQGREVEKVDNQDDLGPDEMVADEEQDKGEVEEVIEDEVAAHGTGGIDSLDIARKQMANVSGLQDEDGKPRVEGRM